MAMRGGLGAAQAEDGVRDVLLTDWHKAGQFDRGLAPASDWIYRIARNRQIEMARKRARPLPEGLIEEAAAPDSHPRRAVPVSFRPRSWRR
ncbi:sigma factor [Phaeovulum sp.]|uniref:sigma factor n=1 Tax=Phaeovulum sp. TaxID=2934796 RepID=UPI00272F8299|nr:sigma factor [Phaeovulum sp.]MDP1668229.1 sigma factor [Phaeovulum sp.]MDP2062443.1 sigma factor [Phaeovulum sp.]MDP3861333.1 sigma factor [Phaeovulum sp.]MDZ4118078.1 sigma factor [Phaeovulum sp.]